jgi:hypothetical protein
MTIRYRGKHPHRINHVSTSAGGRWTHVRSNDGDFLVLDSKACAALTGGKLPQTGQDIRDYRALRTKPEGNT